MIVLLIKQKSAVSFLIVNPFYSSGAMHHDFLEKYCRLAKVPRMVLHNIYCTLLEDQSGWPTLPGGQLRIMQK